MDLNEIKSFIGTNINPTDPNHLKQRDFIKEAQKQLDDYLAENIKPVEDYLKSLKEEPNQLLKELEDDINLINQRIVPLGMKPVIRREMTKLVLDNFPFDVARAHVWLIKNESLDALEQELIDGINRDLLDWLENNIEAIVLENLKKMNKKYEGQVQIKPLQYHEEFVVKGVEGSFNK